VIDGVPVTIENGRLQGNDITFKVAGMTYSGRVSGDMMQGVAKGHTTKSWSASRVRE
jgi:hypothetical protein